MAVSGGACRCPQGCPRAGARRSAIFCFAAASGFSEGLISLGNVDFSRVGGWRGNTGAVSKKLSRNPQEASSFFASGRLRASSGWCFDFDKLWTVPSRLYRR